MPLLRVLRDLQRRMASIRERPAEADDRPVPGHWEGDLLCGANHSYMVTLVERASRFMILLKVPSSDTATVVATFTKRIGRLLAELRRSLTGERGKERRARRLHRRDGRAGLLLRSSQPLGSAAATRKSNGLLRLYFAKGTDLSNFSQAHLNKIALRLNQRPRKTLGFESPADGLSSVLQ